MRCEIQLWRCLFLGHGSFSPSRGLLHQRAKSVKASRPWVLQMVVVGVGDRVFPVATAAESLANPAREHGQRGKTERIGERRGEEEKRRRKKKTLIAVPVCRIVSCRVRACS